MDLLRSQFPANDFALLGLILLLPLVGAFVNGLFGKRLGKDGVRTMALAAVGGSFFLSVVAAVLVATAPGERVRLVWKAWEWFKVTGALRREFPIDVAFSIDALSATMALVVTGVGFLIHLYSTAYMDKDAGYHRYFAYLNLFIFSMMVLVLGDNLAVLFVGWEGVGLCSYLLIGFWFDDPKKAAAGTKAFIVNRIGDFGLLVAMAMLLFHVGTLSWGPLEERVSGLAAESRLWPLGNLHQTALPTFVADLLTPDQPWFSSTATQPGIYASIATVVALMLFLGCAGKSAQVPLYVWLPDAMAGPTPVSALIHAATMVTAGVYLVARCSFLFVLSPTAMAVIAGTGAFTALFAATIAFAQTDLKKVLAYSTVSQLGFMFLGVGVGAFAAGMFHVVTHAFFKGCLFLCAGSVIYAMHARIHDEAKSQDMRYMGGLRKYMPVTHATFLASCAAIAGFPFLSGFWSKDEILFVALNNRIKAPNGQVPTWWPSFAAVVYAMAVVAAIGTAFYMFRAYFMTFWGDFRGWTIVKRRHGAKVDDHGHDEHHGHDGPLEGPPPKESPRPMTIPLVILAALAVAGGLLNAEPIAHLVHEPELAPLGHFWSPVFAKASSSVVVRAGADSLLLPLLFVGMLLFAIGAGAAYWVYVVKSGEPATSFVERFPRLHRLVENKWKVDELYELTVVGMLEAMGETAAQFDRLVIDGLLARVTAGVVAVTGGILRLFQTGRVQVYAAAMVIGVAVLGWFFLTPHAEASVDDSSLRTTGDLMFTAAPGHGYSYRWYDDGQQPPPEFGSKATHAVQLARCEERRITLEVQNLFGRTSSETFTACRETTPGCCGRGKPASSGTPAVPLPTVSAPPRIPPGTYDAGLIDDIIKGRQPAPAPGGGR
jgi:NADH-quinone oxidoreductase subunit L